MIAMNKHLNLLVDTDPAAIRKTLAITWDILAHAVDHSEFSDFMRQVLDTLQSGLGSDELMIVTGPADKRTCYHLWKDNGKPSYSSMHNAPEIHSCKDAEALLKRRRHAIHTSSDFDPERPPYAHCVQLMAGDQRVGALILARTVSIFQNSDRILADMAGCTLAIAMLNFQNQAALGERVKELTCLYRTAQIAAQKELSTGEVLQQVTELIPPAWHYPEITGGRIQLDERIFQTANYTPRPRPLQADLIVNGVLRGIVEVVYLKNMPVLDEGPFLKEERNLINTLAQQLSIVIERREAEAEQQRLHGQLRHADRLATIGKLAAGVAHELNEPLGNVLGFAQLISHESGLPDTVKNDLAKIESAALHGREIVRKLMLFARQTPPRKEPVQINRIIEMALALLETRMTASHVQLVRQLDESIPETVVDTAQYVQVVVNLAVNALQAMPEGGSLVLSTKKTEAGIQLIVEDTGTGMSESVRKQIFLPFFTTKDVNEGTGLGLAVVHGIVTAHGGTIEVNSEPGVGTTFIVTLPVVSDGDNA